MKESEVKKMLPIGSVVTLQEGTKKLMIVGRFQQDVMEDKAYNYTAVLYPEGTLNTNEMFLFNREDIAHIYFMGYQCQEEIQFREYAVEQLKKIGMLEPEEKEMTPDAMMQS